MVAADRFMAKDTLCADVVLPSTTHFEINSYQRYPDYVRLRRKLIEPIGEARNDLLIIAGLSNRLGFGHLYPQTEEETIEKAFSNNLGLLKKLKKSEDGVAIEIIDERVKAYRELLLELYRALL